MCWSSPLFNHLIYDFYLCRKQHHPMAKSDISLNDTTKSCFALYFIKSQPYRFSGGAKRITLLDLFLYPDLLLFFRFVHSLAFFFVRGIILSPCHIVATPCHWLIKVCKVSQSVTFIQDGMGICQGLCQLINKLIHTSRHWHGTNLCCFKA